MEIFVDDSRIDTASIPDATLEDALRHVQATLCAPVRMVIGIRCDGKDIGGDLMAATLRKPLSSFERLEVFTDTKDALVVDVMTQAAASLEQTEIECGRVAELLTEGKTTAGIQALSHCVGAWQQIHDAVSKSVRMLELDMEHTTIHDQRLIDMILRPTGVLLQIKEALRSQDHVLLADVLQYELGDVTEQWRLIIADLRNRAEGLAANSG